MTRDALGIAVKLSGFQTIENPSDHYWTGCGNANLVLELRIASARSTYPTQNANVQQPGSGIARPNRFLEFYRQRADGSWQLLRRTAGAAHDGIGAARGVQSHNVNCLRIRFQV